MNITLAALVALLLLGSAYSQMGAGEQVRVINRGPNARYCRSFKTSFETMDDFKNFEVTPDKTIGTTHGLSKDKARTGSQSHKAEITSIEDSPHRGFPAVQLFKTDEGSMEGPVYITFFVYLSNLNFGSGKWLTIAEVGADDNAAPGKRYISVSLDTNFKLGYSNVPTQNVTYVKKYDTTTTFPQNKWVNVTLYVDFDNVLGITALWQDNVLIATANVNGGAGRVAQFHGGMFADNLIPSGVVYNDDLTIWQTIKADGSCPQSGTPTAFDLTTIEATNPNSSGASKIGMSIAFALAAASVIAYLV
ncbi:hypothetical protein AKO1_015836 [Acrasis kona]|uniref:Uncharacterized protein n=1 Tax=Acrasis kona TaxID=1008807 RepID=A0AAW2ZH81_9EUKA